MVCIQEKAYYGTFGNFTKNTPQVYSFPKENTNKLQKDSFEKANNQQAQQQSFKGKWLTKENMIIGGAGLAAVGIAVTVALVSRRNLSKTLNVVQGSLSDTQKALSVTQEKLQAQAEQAAENQKLIEELKGKLGKIVELPDDLKEAKNLLVKKYQSLIQDPKLSYDPLTPPAQVEMVDNIALRYANQLFKLEDLSGFERKASLGDILDTAKLREILSQNGAAEVSLPMTAKVNPVKSPNASIAGIDITDLGKTVNSDFKTNYGKRISWSEEKIARDIMQNFYDGHGNTLDGVKIAVKQLPNGEYNVRVSGLATFDYENLQYMGSGSKVENPYNAGGFGEGAKVLVANMLGKGDAKSVKYACADWELTFDAANGIVRRTLKKVNPIEGNNIEFTTNNKKLADAILDSINYFEHSQNPDFKGLHFDSRDFGFKFLENADEKGNIYLTQRFELEKTGNWDNGLDNLRLIFKRKPDPEKFKKINGIEMPKDRDRQFLTFDDIENYTKYFANGLSDEDLLKAFMTTKPRWANLPLGSKKTALKSFVEGLIDEMYSRGLAIDYSNSKFLFVKYNPSDAISDMIQTYNYKVCPDIFEHIGMLSAEEVFKRLSIHKPVAPTIEEIKKFKILEEAMRVVKEDIDVVRKAHAQNPIFKFKPDMSKEKFGEYITDMDIPHEIRAIVKKYVPQESSWHCPDNFRELDDESFKACKKEIEDFVISKLKTAAIDDSIYKQYLMLNKTRDAQNILDLATKEYFKKFSSFDLIETEDITKPRYIFDRHNETAQNTLGEAITRRKDNYGKQYLGHWVDREYLDNASFNDLLATWLHEICHKSGGDGSAQFTYTLTDMLQVLLNPSNIKNRNVKLAALEELFNQAQKPLTQAA